MDKVWTLEQEVFIISMDQSLLVYKVNNSVQSSLLSSLVLTLIHDFSYWSTSRSLSHNMLSVIADVRLILKDN